MLEINNLAVSFNEKSILNGCSFNCDLGKIYGLVGLNGSGKTTLLNSIYGFVKLGSGDIIFQNKTISRNDIAFLETQNYFYSNITAAEYLSLFPKNNTNLIEEYLKHFQLPLDEIIDNFSTGMKKKLAIIGLISFDKPIVILDEPFNGLDLEANYYVEKLILHFKSQNKIVIVTSHILATLFPICDEILWLKNGKIEDTFQKNQFNQLQTTLFID